MNSLRQMLAVVFYLIWIPLGILILAGIVFLIAANPFGGLLELFQAGGATSPAGGFPTQEQIQQFQQFQQQGPGSGESKDFVPAPTPRP